MADFNFDYDISDIEKSLRDIEANSTDNSKEIPAGKYEVKIEKIEMKSTKDGGKPMGFVQMRIQEGEYKNHCLFYNQVLIGFDKKTGQLSAFGIHNFNRFLKSLDSGLEISFKDFNQYANLMLDVSERVEKLTYAIEYSINNGFANYKVKEIYEDEDETAPF